MTNEATEPAAVNTDGGQGQGGAGPATSRTWSQRDYHHPAAAWGAAVSVGKVVARSGEFIDSAKAIQKMNHENDGFDCPGCAWPDSIKGLKIDLCENGIKHVTWEMTRKRVDREFFATHTVTEVEWWSEVALEDQGRLTEPMSYDPATDS